MPGHCMAFSFFVLHAYIASHAACAAVYRKPSPTAYQRSACTGSMEWHTLTAMHAWPAHSDIDSIFVAAMFCSPPPLQLLHLHLTCTARVANVSPVYNGLAVGVFSGRVQHISQHDMTLPNLTSCDVLH
jgi:hypothetical protein